MAIWGSTPTSSGTDTGDSGSGATGQTAPWAAPGITGFYIVDDYFVFTSVDKLWTVNSASGTWDADSNKTWADYATDQGWQTPPTIP